MSIPTSVCAIATLAAAFGNSFTPKLLSWAIQNLANATSLISHSTFISLGLSGGVLKTLDETTLAFNHKLMQDALLAVVDQYALRSYHSAIAQARKRLPHTPENERAIANHLIFSDCTRNSSFSASYSMRRRLRRCCM